MTFSVVLTREVLDDLQRLEEFLIELAQAHGGFGLPGRAVDALHAEMRLLECSPYTCGIAHDHPLERELLIPFDASGCVALLEIVGEREVVVSALRHQREDDHC